MKAHVGMAEFSIFYVFISDNSFNIMVIAFTYFPFYVMLQMVELGFDI